jgi:hypothetical protein
MIRNAITAAYAAICSTLRRSITGTGPMPHPHQGGPSSTAAPLFLGHHRWGRDPMTLDA